MRYDSQVDTLFREDAQRLGYLKDDPHEPGNGRGLWAYYRDHSMQPPEYLERQVYRHEAFSLDLDRPLQTTLWEEE